MKIYQAASILDAQLVCDMLLSSGIDARVSGAYLSGAIGELPVDTVVGVWIADAGHEERARSIIDAMEAQRQAPVKEFNCAGCGAEVTSNFNNCWQCGDALRSGSG